MTLDEFLRRLAALGPWKARGRLGLIRRVKDGLCPLQAVSRAEGMLISGSQLGGTAAFAKTLGMPVELVDDIQDAVDGLAPTYDRMGAFPSETARLNRLRTRLLTACGL